MDRKYQPPEFLEGETATSVVASLGIEISSRGNDVRFHPALDAKRKYMRLNTLLLSVSV